ncbi:MAG: M1 family metallopeptidase [Bacteroidia bacterium]|nr:M1 family metallopeptidase [Bacteroidia bacterium]
MRWYHLPFYIALTTISSLQAQRPYFQQRVEYFIRVRLEPAEHRLHGHLRLHYYNNSPDTLRGIYFHLWPNAYSRRGTAFDRQQRIGGKTRFYFSRPEERGFIDSLDFRVEGIPVKPLPATKGPAPAPGYSRAFLKHTPDVVWLPLPQPLVPGKKVEIETPFRVQVPITFSRMGRSGVQYSITQWYPKPAVYDTAGWHPLPYLDQGEFYSEWGRYEVEIEVPENFIVAATGVLQTEAEKLRLQERERLTREWLAQRETSPSAPSPSEKAPRVRIRTPQSTRRQVSFILPSLPSWARDTSIASSYKKIRFVQDSIHDFAWFADPRYGIVSDTLTLPNGHRVACVGVFHLEYYQAWQYAPRYIAEAIQKLSQWVGPYPYAHATAVEGGLEAGGGMEYPMITVIIPTTDTSTLRQIVVHEVGHNWFQGLFASNERLHPWQDEGINSYYERRILTEDPTYQSDPSQVVRAIGPRSRTSIPVEKAFYHHLNADIAPAKASHEHSLISYGYGVYTQTSDILRAAVYAFTPERWDAAMRRYFQQGAFRHPSPESWAESLEQEGLPGRALLKYLRTDKEIDLRLRRKRLTETLYEVRVEEPTARLPRPFWIEAAALDKEEWRLKEYRLPLDSSVTVALPKETKLFLVNPQAFLYERRGGNNFFYTRRLFAGWRNVRFAVGAPIRFPQYYATHIGIFPAIGYNYRDGLLLGGGMFHGVFPKRVGEFHVLPMYSLLQQTLRGSAGITLRAFPADSRVQLVEVRLRTASFAGFWRSKASVEVTLRRRYDTFSGRTILRLRSHHLAFQDVESQHYTWINKGKPAYIAVDWERRWEDPIFTTASIGSVGYDLQGHSRVEVESRFYWKPFRKWHLWARSYAGWTAAGAPDYLLFRAAGFDPFGEVVLLDRFRESSNRFMRQQIPETQGGARLPVDTLRGHSLLAGSIEVSLPQFSFLVLRGDAGYFFDSQKAYWGVSLGVPVARFRDRLLVGGYFPLLGSAFQNHKPAALREVIQNFTWSINVPLDLRWALPW